VRVQQVAGPVHQDPLPAPGRENPAALIRANGQGSGHQGRHRVAAAPRQDPQRRLGLRGGGCCHCCQSLLSVRAKVGHDAVNWFNLFRVTVIDRLSNWADISSYHDIQRFEPFATCEDCNWLEQYLATKNVCANLVANNKLRDIIDLVDARFRDAARSLLVRHKIIVRTLRSIDYVNVILHAEACSALVITSPFNSEESFWFLFDGDHRINKFTENKDVVFLSALLSDGWKVVDRKTVMEFGLRQEQALANRFIEKKVTHNVHRSISIEDCKWLSCTFLFQNWDTFHSLPDDFMSKVDSLVSDVHKKAAMLILSGLCDESLFRCYTVIDKLRRSNDTFFQGLVLKPRDDQSKYIFFPYPPASDTDFEPYGIGRNSRTSTERKQRYAICLSLLLHEGWKVSADLRVNPGDVIRELS
jgi:hypothetical protein